MAENKFEGIEISESLLDSIAGGVLDDTSKQNIEAYVNAFKQEGLTLEETLKQFSFVSETSGAEILDYIKEAYARII